MVLKALGTLITQSPRYFLSSRPATTFYNLQKLCFLCRLSSPQSGDVFWMRTSPLRGSAEKTPSAPVEGGLLWRLSSFSTGKQKCHRRCGQRLNITPSLCFHFQFFQCSHQSTKPIPRNWHRGGINCGRTPNSACL